MLGTVLVVLLVLMLLGSFPAWPHSRNWGYGPTGGLRLILGDSGRNALAGPDMSGTGHAPDKDAPAAKALTRRPALTGTLPSCGSMCRGDESPAG